MKTLTEREAALGRKLTAQEIESIGMDMMARAKISHLPIVPYKEAPWWIQHGKGIGSSDC